MSVSRPKSNARLFGRAMRRGGRRFARRRISGTLLARRRGQATLDYALVMGIVVPLAIVCFWFVPRIMQSVYDMSCVVWGWPFP
ncbi:MAG: hypothetical protein R3B96_16570 [Pirellulaceae bacterium]|nr:hypothetical protein [Planctomycetales bacterium]